MKSQKSLFLKSIETIKELNQDNLNTRIEMNPKNHNPINNHIIRIKIELRNHKKLVSQDLPILGSMKKNIKNHKVSQILMHQTNMTTILIVILLIIFMKRC